VAVTAVISDFGGVLTTPLVGSFQKFQERSGISLADLGIALATLAAARGDNPLFELETGRLTEADFLTALGTQLSDQLRREIVLDGFGETYFADLEVNHPFMAFMRRLREQDLKMAICTNNVREWSPLWRAMAPVEEIFEVIVDSSEVGARKPDSRIYEVTLEQLGVAPAEAVFIDDLEINCAAARELGLHAVWFQTTEQAIADVETALAGRR
jgi:putative hydrolase of the HAD superfamily